MKVTGKLRFGDRVVKLYGIATSDFIYDMQYEMIVGGDVIKPIGTCRLIDTTTGDYYDLSIEISSIDYETYKVNYTTSIISEKDIKVDKITLLNSEGKEYFSFTPTQTYEVHLGDQIDLSLEINIGTSGPYANGKLREGILRAITNQRDFTVGEVSYHANIHVNRIEILDNNLNTLLSFSLGDVNVETIPSGVQYWKTGITFSETATVNYISLYSDWMGEIVRLLLISFPATVVYPNKEYNFLSRVRFV